ncbi:MAG: HD domain-containing protein [Chloroflexota bacterium]
MRSMEELREGVRKSLPEVNDIQDEDLRNKVVEAWAFALSQTDLDSIEAMHPSTNPPTPSLISGTHAEHFRGIARMSLAIADVIESVVGEFKVDRDILLACALCHDLGEPFEFSPANQARWRANPAKSGYPAVRHPVYGVYVALTVGLPEEVVHCCGAHAREGDAVQRSLETTIVNLADSGWWKMLDRAGLVRWE